FCLGVVRRSQDAGWHGIRGREGHRPGSPEILDARLRRAQHASSLGYPESRSMAASTGLAEVASMAEKRSWEPMTVRFVGRVSEILRGGGGKLSASAGDPGDSRKPTGSG